MSDEMDIRSSKKTRGNTKKNLELIEFLTSTDWKQRLRGEYLFIKDKTERKRFRVMLERGRP